jgi:membrane-associated phospholipid phosphatase
LSASTSILITAIVNLKWKISAHMVGIGGLCGAIATLVIHKPEPPFGLLYVCILIAGLVGYARLRLQAHTPAQVYSGFLLGVGCTCTLLSFL